MYILSFTIGFIVVDSLLKYTRLNRGRYFTCNAIGTLVISWCTFSQTWSVVSLQQLPINQKQPIIAIDVALALIVYHICTYFFKIRYMDIIHHTSTCFILVFACMRTRYGEYTSIGMFALNAPDVLIFTIHALVHNQFMYRNLGKIIIVGLELFIRLPFTIIASYHGIISAITRNDSEQHWIIDVISGLFAIVNAYVYVGLSIKMLSRY